MNTRTLVIFERDETLLDVIAEMLQSCCEDMRVLKTTDQDEAWRMIQEYRPCIVITEAVPVLDVLNPKSFQAGDPGFLLMKNIRESQNQDINSCWLVLLMSRMLEDMPDEVRDLIGERAYLYGKPFSFPEAKETLTILLSVLFRRIPA